MEDSVSISVSHCVALFHPAYYSCPPVDFTMECSNSRLLSTGGAFPGGLARKGYAKADFLVDQRSSGLYLLVISHHPVLDRNVSGAYIL